MNKAKDPSKEIVVSIAPWLTVRDGVKAIEFYKSAFGAVEVYRLDVPDGSVIARLAVEGAEFWVSDGAVQNGQLENLGGDTVRMILTVAEPDAIFQRALHAGAEELSPVSEGHGWRIGRLMDPFGLHWEIGRPDE